MIKFRVFILVFLFTLTGCSNLGSIRNVNGNQVLNIEDPQDFNTIAYVDYFDYQTLKNNEIKKSNLVFAKPDLSNIPVNGYVVAHISAPDIDSANSKWWHVVIMDSSGKLVKRIQGTERIANYKITNGLTTWKNMIIVNLPDITAPFEVFVVSDVVKKRWGYRVLAK